MSWRASMSRRRSIRPGPSSTFWRTSPGGTTRRLLRCGPTPAVRGIDHYNAESVATREALSYEHVVREWDLARNQLKDAIEAMPPERMAVPLIFPWGSLGTIAQLIDIFASHEIEHAEEVAQIIADSQGKG